MNNYRLGLKPDGSYRDYISWSSFQVWHKNKDEYRRRYYENESGFSSQEMAFGKEVGEMLENNHESLKHIPRYNTPEYRIELKCDGYKILAYLDTFCKDTFAIGEYKTSHTTKDGKVPWTQKKVNKHRQLDWYSMLVKESLGKVKNEVWLAWLETDWEENFITYQGHKFSQGRRLKLTGKVEIFKRKIYEKDRKKIKKEIEKTVRAIDKDFRSYELSRKDVSQKKSKT